MHEVLNRIGGESRPATGDATFDRRDPADARQVVTRAPESSREDVKAAVAAAREAFAEWSATTPSQRAGLLEKAAQVLRGQVDDNARDMVGEAGKPLGAARNEAARTARNLDLYAGEALRLTGWSFPSDDPGATVTAVREPVGVVGVITPWNFPLNLASRKIGPALAAGNTVVFKPSPMTSYMGDRLANAFQEAGFPPGVVNIVHGFDAGRFLVEDVDVDAVSFTGSTATGRKIHDAMGLGRRVQLELGGNNPLVVLEDADLDHAAAVVARSSFGMSGQACTGAGRILVQASVHDELLDRVVELARSQVLGSGLAEGTTMGPLVDESAIEGMQRAVQASVDAGARVVVGGERATDGDLAHGWFWPATVLAEVEPTTHVACHEVFGPVVGFERVASLDEAIARGNDTEYGLTASICTRDLGAAQRFTREIQAGMVKVNRPTVGAAFNAPFGGFGQSGTSTHKEQLGPTVMDFHTRIRTIFMGDPGGSA
jgi:acyl-CoA reductase-like NAD-dependent aldehyde dehydrogenase